MEISYENTFGWYSALALNSLSGYPTDKTNSEFLPGFTSFDFNFVALLNPARSVTLNASVQNIMKPIL